MSLLRHVPITVMMNGVASYENRIRFPIEIVKRTRQEVGENFGIIYRLSMLDLVDGGSTFDEVVQLAKEIEKAGATIINTGIGWHESSYSNQLRRKYLVAFTWVTEKLKGLVNIPLITSNRINTPEMAERIGFGRITVWCRWRARYCRMHFCRKGSARSQ